ncbi:MAG: glycosyltransferase family 4 protein [Bacteroidales bacterium]|jgi:glycosyltransferase involved in cell wall biosynthesis|nr:glycosyltransferase family 4 protein [Bacteroidales bacterium]
MKIIIFSPFYPFKRGGIVNFASNLFHQLKKNDSVNVKAITFTTLYPKFFYPKGFSQLSDKKTEEDVDAKPILSSINLFSCFKAAKYVNNEKPDVLIINYWLPYLAISMGKFIRLVNKNIKIITINHNIVPHEKHSFDNCLNKYYFYKKNNLHITLSEQVKADLLSIQPKAKVKVISHPLYDYGEKLDKNVALEKLGMPKKKTLLFFGLIRDYKGLDILINTFSELDDSYQLLIAGECRQKGKTRLYKDLIKKSKNQNIKFANKFIADEEVKLYFSAADVCVLPYRDATQSGVTAVSFHFELPMIATNVGGLPEIIKNDETGLIAKEPNTEYLKETIINYFEHCNIELFKQNIKKIKKELTWDNFTKNLLEFVCH